MIGIPWHVTVLTNILPLLKHLKYMQFANSQFLKKNNSYSNKKFGLVLK